MSLQFLRFPKIGAVHDGVPLLDDWVASEKIHGAQLVIAASPAEVRVGKRKAWLAPEEPFFGWQMLRPVLLAAARAVQHAVDSRGTAWLFGELFGGAYPHPAVPPVPSLVAVQTGIWYAPDLRFAVFDVAHKPDGGDAVFLADERVRELASGVGLNFVPLLGRGRKSELSGLSVHFATRIPDSLGLPVIAGNFAEGYVLKYAQQAPISVRPAVKRKLPQFDERRFNESRAFDPGMYLTSEALFELGYRLINTARIASARSKVGEHHASIVEEAVLDAFVDLRDMLPRQVEALTHDEEQLPMQHLASCVAGFLHSV